MSEFNLQDGETKKLNDDLSLTEELEAASTFSLDLTAAVQGGKMLARLEGQVTFVSGGIPGEHVSAFIPVRRRGYLEAEGRGVLRPSPSRVNPPCKYFGENGRQRGTLAAQAQHPLAPCGGCQYQHIAYERQLSLKTEIVQDVLRRIGKIPDAVVLDMVPSPHPYHYRNKASWLVTEDGELAFRESQSHTAVPVESCELLTPGLQQVLHSVQAASLELGLGGLATGIEARVLRGPDGSERSTLLVEFDPSVSDAEAEALAVSLIEVCPLIVGVAGQRGLEGEAHQLAGVERLPVIYLGEELIVSAPSFFQVNQPLAEMLAEQALEQCGSLQGKDVLDVYSGVGAFTIPLSRRAEAVIAIELEGNAIQDARETIARLGIENITMLEGDAAQSLRAVLPGTVACALVDPPRSGCAPDVLRQLVRIKAPRLVYVSCDPATLARDLRVLIDHGYLLERLQPFDMFPQTAHIENLATLRLARKFRAQR